MCVCKIDAYLVGLGAVYVLNRISTYTGHVYVTVLGVVRPLQLSDGRN